MKKLPRILLVFITLTLGAISAQTADKSAPAPAAAQRLTKFDLDFPGGTPGELTAAIQQAMKRPLNAIIPVEYASWKLPPVKMNGVDVLQLFRAMEMASQALEVVATGFGQYQQGMIRYGFRANNNQPIAESDDTVWYFFVEGRVARLPKISRFYLLAPYLDAGLTVDDITTAIQTGWKMRGDATPPALSFHKETRLLIAVGDSGGLDVIEAVLKALDAIKVKRAVVEKSPEEKKTKS